MSAPDPVPGAVNTSGGMLTRSEDIPGGHAYCDAQIDAGTRALARCGVKIAEQRARAELAEAALAEVRKFCTGDPRAAGSLVAADILGILNPDTPAPSPEGDQA